MPAIATVDPMVLSDYCTATNRQGNRCRRYAIKGGNVCLSHGGGAPQVRRKAQERLLGAADLMVGVLINIARNRYMPAAARVTAARDLLDRAGIGVEELRGRGLELSDTSISIVVVQNAQQPSGVTLDVQPEMVDTRQNGHRTALPPWAAALGITEGKPTE